MSHSLRLLALTLVACGVPHVAPHAYVPARAVEVPVALCWLETGGTRAPGGFGAAGWARASTWDATTSALLVRHPKGDVLIDTGLSVDGEAEAQELSWWPRFIFHQTAGRNEQRGRLTALLARLQVGSVERVILSHAHPDHAGGVAQLPGVRVFLAEEELGFVRSHVPAVMPAQGRALEERGVAIPFAATPYANFDQSWDVFGDGTIVVVPTFGHTPGSVATFVTVGKRRLVHAGDLINLQESLDRRVPKSAVMRGLTDEDPRATDAQVARLIELHQQDPELFILPAHDRAAYETFFGAMPVNDPVPRCVNAETPAG